MLDQLVERAKEAGIYDLDFGKDPYDKPPLESLDEATAGIGALLAISSLIGIGLAVAAVMVGVNAIMQHQWLSTRSTSSRSSKPSS